MSLHMYLFLIEYRKNLPSTIDDMIRMQKQLNKKRNTTIKLLS
jgi:hypothetical protein